VSELGERALRILRDLVAIDTSNPPGRESAAVEYLAARLERVGIASHRFEPEPGRGSIVARLQGSGRRRPVLLASHLDVVPADGAAWTHPPFAAEVVDGIVWGRGTVDMKSLTAIHVACVETLAVLGAKPEGDIVLLATADEEAGSALGIEHVLETAPELILDAEFGLNEGGGHVIRDAHGRARLTVQCAEKGVLEITLRAVGKGGHGAYPSAENPILRLGRAVARITPERFPVLASPVADAFSAAFGEQGVSTGSEITAQLGWMTRNTLTPTIMRAGELGNVVPVEAVARLDGRYLPTSSPEELSAQLRALLDDDSIQVHAEEVLLPSSSPVDTTAFARIRDAVESAEPGLGVAPILSSGTTDSGPLRRAGVAMYGLRPMWDDVGASAASLMHAVDERISVASIELGARVYWSLLTERDSRS
jgi:acetylornithine deacetylase/succinyl-diaminopimelate desuccinylase-like protein